MNFPTRAERKNIFRTIKTRRYTKRELSNELGINKYLVDFYIGNLLYYGLIRKEGLGPGTRYIATKKGIDEEGSL